MSRNEVLLMILIATLSGMIIGLLIRLQREQIPFKMYFYVSTVLLTDMFIYPLFFPIFFNKKRYSLYKSNEIISELKNLNISTKKINRKKLEKNIYESLTVKKTCSLWLNTVKNSFTNFDQNVDSRINEIKNSQLVALHKQIVENNRAIKQYKKRISENKKKIRRNKIIIAWLNLLIFLKKVSISSIDTISIIKSFILSSQVKIDNNKYLEI